MVHNIHRRQLAATADEVWLLIQDLGAADNRIWPAGWPTMQFDPELAIGARGHHGPVHYRVDAFDRLSGLVLAFLPPTGLEGHHAFRLLPGEDDGHVILEHEVRGGTRGGMRLVWPVAMRWLHDAVLEELLDQAERALGHEPERPYRRNAWVRLILRMTGRPVRSIPVRPEDTQASGLPRVDWSDKYVVSLPADASHDPDHWRRALFADPRSKQWLLRARDMAGRRVGLKPAHNGEEPMFDICAIRADSVVIGGDDRHLDFRVVVAVTDGIPARLALTTAVKFHNKWGRRYMRAVAPLHHRIVPHTMRRAVAASR